MEPISGSKVADHSEHHLSGPDFTHHRSKISPNNDSSLKFLAADSGYSSSYNTPNVSSNLSLISSPNRNSTATVGISNNLITIPEISDNTKLTPVTQNIRKITDFHITTPKSNDFPLIGCKRHSVAEINFQDYQSTPKKVKIDSNQSYSSESGVFVKNLQNTPHRGKRSRTQKKLFRKKLRSAPDFNIQENVDPDVFSPYRGDVSPIGRKIPVREKRSPLAEATIQSSTPKSFGYRSKVDEVSFKEKSPSVKKLLSFTDQQFESLLNSNSKSSEAVYTVAVPKDEKLSTVEEGFETPVKQIRSTIIQSLAETSTTTTTTSATSCKTEDIYQEQSFREYKRIYPFLNNVLQDREIAKRRAIENRRSETDNEKDIQKCSPELKSNLAEYICSKKWVKRSSTTSTHKGFSDILNIIPDSSDMEISPLKTPVNKSPSIDLEWDHEMPSNSIIKNINSTIHLDQNIVSESPLISLPSHEKKYTSEETVSSVKKHNFNIRTDGIDIQLDENIECEPLPVTPSSQQGDMILTEKENMNISDIDLAQTAECNPLLMTPPKQKRSPSEEKSTPSAKKHITFSENQELIIFSNDGALEKLPRTPKKQKQCSIDKENLEIHYPKIPHTPSKKPFSTQFKRIKAQTCIKRSRKFYDGSIYLDIIRKLESYSLVLEKIFELLSSHDLFNLTRVSKTWKRIISTSVKTNERLKIYVEQWKYNRENYVNYKNIENLPYKIDGLLSSSDIKKIERSVRTPFSQSNKNERKRSSDIQHSPPVSPSKRKFHENQKVVRTLAGDEKLTKCPRCGKSSRIFNTAPIHDPYLNNQRTFQATMSTFSRLSRSNTVTTMDNNNSSNNNNYSGNSDGISFSQPITFQQPRPKGYLMKSLSVDSGLVMASSVHNQKRISIPFQPFAECSGLFCKFRFCLECQCEHHPGERCKLTTPLSPSKEDLQNGIIQISSASATRSLKSRRKCLKRLCL